MTTTVSETDEFSSDESEAEVFTAVNTERIESSDPPINDDTFQEVDEVDIIPDSDSDDVTEDQNTEQSNPESTRDA